MSEVILITGGTGKFGQKMVAHFVGKGWKVLLTTTDKQEAEALFENKGLQGDVAIFEADFAESDAINRLTSDILNAGHQVNHLINNARSLAYLKINDEGLTERHEFLSEFLVDVVVPYELSMGLYKAQSDTLKTITNISSQYSLVAVNPNLYDDNALPSPIQYGVSKSALNHLTKELAVRLASGNVRVNAVAYGGVEGRVNDDFKMRYSKLCPLGRMLTEDEIIGPIDFLTSKASSAIVGHVLVADGGWSVW